MFSERNSSGRCLTSVFASVSEHLDNLFDKHDSCVDFFFLIVCADKNKQFSE